MPYLIQVMVKTLVQGKTNPVFLHQKGKAFSDLEPEPFFFDHFHQLGRLSLENKNSADHQIFQPGRVVYFSEPAIFAEDYFVFGTLAISVFYSQAQKENLAPAGRHLSFFNLIPLFVKEGYFLLD